MEEEKSLKYYVEYPNANRYSFELSITKNVYITVTDNTNDKQVVFIINIDDAKAMPF